jgi:hypothetical protein
MLRSVLASSLLLACSSCFTMLLWGFESTDEVDPCTGEVEDGLEYDEDTEWSWELFGLRVLLTPVTLALDCLTCPIQACCCDRDEPGCRRCR